MWILLFRFFLVCCLTGSPLFLIANTSLASWRDGNTKQRILTFVAHVTDSNHPSFVPPDKRIAVFDNDGTLVLEKPFFIQTAFTQNRAAQMMRDDPKLAEVNAFKIFVEKDSNYRSNLSKDELEQLVLTTHSGMTEEQFSLMCEKFLADIKHPRFDCSYTKLVYQPMLELMELLRVNGFKIYLCTGGGTEFVRVLADVAYDIPPEHIIGTSMETAFMVVDGKPSFMQLGKFAFSNNVRENKPRSIQRVIGKPPIIAVGNSNGDIDMLKYAKGQKAGLAILVYHDDPVREYAYDEGSQEALKVAKEQNWVVVSMKDDFSQIFPSTSD